MEVEVGAVGSWQSFKSLGGKGRMVIQEDETITGAMLTVILRIDQNRKACLAV